MIGSLIHYISFRVLTHATENKSSVASALDFFLKPCLRNEEDLKEIVDTVTADGHFGNPISITTAEISKKNECMRFVDFFNRHISDDDRELLRSQMPERLDDDLNFYMRFDKQAALAGKLVFTESADAVFVRVKIETYPRSWEKAGAIVEELFG